MIIVKFNYNDYKIFKYQDLFKQFFKFNVKSCSWHTNKQVPQWLLLECKKLGAQVNILNYNDFTNINNNQHLYTFQKQAVKKILNAYNNYLGFGLFYSVGCGKSLISLDFINNIYKDNYFVILTPSAVKKQYYKEIAKFGYDFDAILIDGDKKKRQKLYDDKHKIIVMTYETFRNDVEFIKDKYNILICDEASKLKSHKSKIYKCLENYKKKFMLCLTGTPIVNKLEDVFNIVNLCCGGIITRKYFYENFCEFKDVRIGFGRTIKTISHYKNLDLFISIISEASDRKKKEDIADQLPSITYIDRFVENTKQQIDVKKELIQIIKSVNGTNALFTGFTTLRLLDNGINTLKSSGSQYIDLFDFEEEKSNKIEQLMNDVEEIGEQQIIIFTHFKYTASEIFDILNKQYNGNVLFITGDDSQQNKDNKIEDFKTKKYQYLVCTDVLGFGISFSDVDYLINYDLPLSFGDYEQRCGRIHRIDSKNKKFVINYVGGVVGFHIKEILDNKIELNNDVIEKIINIFNEF